MFLLAIFSDLADWGYLGLFLGSVLAASVVPFSSDFLLIGMLAAGASPFWSVFWASLGSGIGGIITYWMGCSGRWEWIQKRFRVRPETLEKQKERVERYGSWLAFLSWVPILGGVFPLALGFYRVNAWSVSLLIVLGKTARFVAWALFVEWIKPMFA